MPCRLKCYLVAWMTEWLGVDLFRKNHCNGQLPPNMQHTIASMAEGKLRTPIGGMEFAQELFSKGEWDGEAILLEKYTVIHSELVMYRPIRLC